MTILFWICGLIAAYVAITFGFHMIKMKSDPYYRYKAQETEQQYQFEQKVIALRKSDNPMIKEMTDILVGKSK